MVVSVRRMGRAGEIQKVQRLNYVRELLRRFARLPDAVSRMAAGSGISPRQAYRYLRQAQYLKQPPHRRCHDRFYRQTFPKAGSGPSYLRKPHRFVVERDREPSAPRGFARREEGVAKRSAREGHAIHFEYRFDRLRPQNSSRRTYFSP